MFRIRLFISALGLTALLGACQAPLAVSAPRPVLKLQLRLGSNFRILSPSQPEQVASIRYCLLEHPTGVSPAGSEGVEPVGPVFRHDLDHAPPLELSFSNLRANGENKSYTLAVAAFDINGNNITNATGSNAERQRVTIAGESGNFTLSTSGGDPDHPGSVRVEAGSYELSGSAALGLVLKLLDS